MKKRPPRLVLAAALLVPLGLVLGGNSWACWHYRAGQKALKQRAFAEAQPHFAKCLEVWFLSADAHLLAARAAWRMRTYEEAERHLRLCRQWGGSEEALDLEYKLMRAQRDGLAEVEGPLVRRVLQDHPETILILEVLTPAYMKTYRLANAEECLSRWLEREPNYVQAWLWRAQLYQLLRDQDEVVASYRQIVRLDPDNDGARLQLAIRLSQRRDPQAALEHFEYLQHRPVDSYQMLRGLARCRHALNQPEEARRILDKLVAEYPRGGGALADRGRLALEYESAAEAEKWFRQAVAVMPYEKDANYGLYQSLMHLGKRAEADSVLAEIKRLEADFSRVNELTRAIAHEARAPNLRCEVGLILMRNGEPDEGLRWLASALMEDPWHTATHQALAHHYERSGDREKAANHQRLAQEGKDRALTGFPREAP